MLKWWQYDWTQIYFFLIFLSLGKQEKEHSCLLTQSKNSAFSRPHWAHPLSALRVPLFLVSSQVCERCQDFQRLLPTGSAKGMLQLFASVAFIHMLQSGTVRSQHNNPEQPEHSFLRPRNFFLVWSTPKHPIVRCRNKLKQTVIYFHPKLHISFTWGQSHCSCIDTQGEGSKWCCTLELQPEKKYFKHNGDIPLKSHIHFGMFALTTTLSRNSEGTEQSNIK